MLRRNRKLINAHHDNVNSSRKVNHFVYATLTSHLQMALLLLPTLVMEQADVLLHKGDAELLSGGEDKLVILRTAGGGDVLDTGASSTVDVINEGELRVSVSL